MKALLDSIIRGLIPPLFVAVTVCACNRTAIVPSDGIEESAFQPGPYSIKAFRISDEGGKEFLEFGPAGGGHSSKAKRSDEEPLEGKSVSGDVGQSRQALTADDTVTFLDPTPFPLSAWNLGGLAIQECLDRWEEVGNTNWIGGTVSFQAPWDLEGEAVSPNWYYFRREPGESTYTFESCDDALAHQEVLLCAADLLAEVADSPRDVVWEHSNLEFPPQATRDKFVARELALNILGHLAVLEAPTVFGRQFDSEPAPSFHKVDCPALIWLGLQAPAGQEFGLLPVFGEYESSDYETPFLPPVDSSNVKTLLADRAAHQLHMVRMASRLIRDLVTNMVRDDLAQAEKNRARAGDPVAGLEWMWGLRSDEGAPFNSIRHALRTLYGRLEGILPATSDPAHSDPACWGYAALDVIVDFDETTGEPLDGILGPGLSARWTNRPPESRAQALADSTFTQAGIVVPPSAIPSAFPSPIRDAILNQLHRNAVVLRNPDADPQTPAEWAALLEEFSATESAAAISTLLDGLSDADLRFGLNRAFDKYRLLTDSPPDGPLPSTGPAGLVFADDSPLSSYGGRVVVGGLPVEDIDVDHFAWMGRAQAAAQCPNPIDPVDEENYPRALQGPFDAASFLLGASEQILRGLRSPQVVIPPEAAELPDLAAAITAELDAWAGPGRVSVHPTHTTVFDITPEEMGVTSLEELGENLELILADAPWKVECALGSRATCPEDLGLTRYSPDVLQPSIQFVHPQQESNVILTHRYYLVSRQSAGRAGAGRVLAVLRIPSPGEATFANISNLQRDLLDSIFGSGFVNQRDPTCTDTQSTALPAEHCVGLARNFFVPLSNELTASSEVREDSWRHYLARAKEAAAAADAIGRQMIEAGLAVDFRREGAQEKLALACGEFIDIDAIAFDESEATLTSNTDAELNSCIAPASTDLVFLTADPLPADADVESIQRAVCCVPTAGETDQDDAEFCGEGYRHVTRPGGVCGSPPSVLSHAALGLAPARAEDSGPPDGVCAALATAANTSFTGATAIESAAEYSFTSSPHLLATLGSLSLTVQTDGNWQVISKGEVVMDTQAPLPSDDAGYRFPACRSLPSQCGLAETLIPEDGQDSSSTTDGLHPLATFFAKTFNAPDDYSVRREVERAVWYMGALAGAIPPGTFDVPVPAYLQPESVGDEEGEAEVQLPGFYGSSFEPAGTTPQSYILELPDDPFGTSSLTPEDRAAAGGPGWLIAPEAWLNSEASAGGPAWKRALYAGTTAIVTKNFVNSQIEFGDPVLDLFSVPVLHSDIQSWLRSFSRLNNNCTARQSDLRTSMRSLGANSLFDEEDSFTLLGGVQRDICLRYKHPAFSTAPSGEKVVTRATTIDGQGEDTIFELFGAEYDGDRRATMTVGTPCQYMPGFVNYDCTTGEDDPALPGPCLVNRLGCSANSLRYQRRYADGLRPSVCPPPQRVEMLIDRNGVEGSECEAASVIASSLALACALDRPVVLAPGELPPPIDSLADIALFESWLSTAELAIRHTLDGIVLFNVPSEVVQDFVDGRVGTGSSGQGTQGELMLALAGHLRRIHQGWSDVHGALTKLRGGVKTARLALESADQDTRARALNIAREELELDRQDALNRLETLFGTAQYANSVFAVPSAVISGNGGAAVANVLASLEKLQRAGINERYNGEVRRNIREQALLGVEQDATLESQIVANLAIASSDAFAALSDAMTAATTASLDAQSAILALQNGAMSARFELAQAAGEDFLVTDAFDDEQGVVPLFVNTALRRNYDVLRARYERALEQAKRAAYVARLAVEQRIGVRLEDLDQPIGPLEAPHTWAEDVCTLTGINYAELRSAEPSEPSQVDVNSDFVDAYIGDYVAQLEEFVEFYNIFNPFRESDDLAVLSIRDNLLLPDIVCQHDSDNALYYSDQLYTGGTPRNDAALAGWRVTGCSEGGVCLRVASGEGTLLDTGDTQLAPPLTPGGVSWLKTLVVEDFPGQPQDAGTPPPSPDPIDGETQDPRPPAAVYQTVELDTNSEYVLTWWDMARARNGLPWEAVPDAAPEDGSDDAVRDGADRDGDDVVDIPYPYDVTIYTSDWRVAARTLFGPTRGGPDGTEWSERRALRFTVGTKGEYHVVFSVPAAAEERVSVAISNVELSKPLRDGDSLGTYEQVLGSRVRLGSDCASLTGEEFRSAFERRCENTEFGATEAPTCYWELVQPIVLDTEGLNAGFGPLVGRVGLGNYNHRLLDLAVNVVGSDVIGCEEVGSSTCYGSAYLEYDLRHSAFNVPIDDYVGEVRCFDFAQAAIRGGKALASERFITLPLSSSDRELINQPAFLKSELSGRPLSGTYHFRIKDIPGLQWEHVQDIQLLLNHRYWSRIDRTLN